jgi:hypothetical protein
MSEISVETLLLNEMLSKNNQKVLDPKLFFTTGIDIPNSALLMSIDSMSERYLLPIVSAIHRSMFDANHAWPIQYLPKMVTINRKFPMVTESLRSCSTICGDVELALSLVKPSENMYLIKILVKRIQTQPIIVEVLEL